jgi:hypothetical protein
MWLEKADIFGCYVLFGIVRSCMYESIGTGLVSSASNAIAFIAGFWTQKTLAASRRNLAQDKDTLASSASIRKIMAEVAWIKAGHVSIGDSSALNSVAYQQAFLFLPTHQNIFSIVKT